MLIVGGGAFNYKNIPVDNMSEVLFNILAVYYALFLEYPAAYGVLNVVDRFCLKVVEVSAPQKGCGKNSKQKKKKQKKEFQSISKFMSKFEKYLKTQQQGESDIDP